MLEQLLEVLDERYEAGPTAYVVSRATVEPAGDDHAVVVVFRRTADEPLLRFTSDTLVAPGSGDAVTPEKLGWAIYQVVLEGGSGDVGEPDADGVRPLTL